LVGELSRRADDLVDQRCELHRLRIELKFPGFDLRQIEHLIDDAKKMSSGVTPQPAHAAILALRPGGPAGYAAG
jgi:hypothetical protein